MTSLEPKRVLIAVDAAVVQTGVAVFEDGALTVTATMTCKRSPSDSKGVCPQRFFRYRDDALRGLEAFKRHLSPTDSCFLTVEGTP